MKTIYKEYRFNKSIKAKLERHIQYQNSEYLLINKKARSLKLTLFFPMFQEGSKGSIGGKRVKFHTKVWDRTYIKYAFLA